MPFVLLAVANFALFCLAVAAIITGGVLLFAAAWVLLVVEALSVIGWTRMAARRINQPRGTR
ncbi:membrane protein [Gordonia phage Petra]|uniref:Uncharacterized protein n=2 Tax=root TaxID=1 RepID=A0A2U8UKF8_9CAUD|nr:hypothetical protein [Gordonia westfalica]YP_010095456.1 membrane protein [Gordonia phage Petra]AWN04175.1 hypothetical protein PBI_PETRA_62 [Gordonia phage Petra]SDU65017.1 hypothetical protein SAMN04488548_1342973 [Gordonia westfalica]